MDDHPYLTVYILGCMAAAVLHVGYVLVLYPLRWITKGNILAANLQKLQPAKHEPKWVTIGKKSGIVVLDVALSWIAAAITAWRLIMLILRTLRDVFSSVPEAIKLLRFPLNNNPGLPTESVWAHLYALNIRIGNANPDEADLAIALEEVRSAVPHFNASAAIRHLRALDVLKPEVIYPVSLIADDMGKTNGE